MIIRTSFSAVVQMGLRGQKTIFFEYDNIEACSTRA
jgi:hypothetical protein